MISSHGLPTTLSVPETRLKPADLLLQALTGVRHDPPVMLRLIYKVFSTAEAPTISTGSGARAARQRLG